VAAARLLHTEGGQDGMAGVFKINFFEKIDFCGCFFHRVFGSTQAIEKLDRWNVAPIGQGGGGQDETVCAEGRRGR